MSVLVYRADLYLRCSHVSARAFSDTATRIVSEYRPEVVSVSLDFNSARDYCRNQYGISDYKLLFGIVRKEDVFDQIHAQYWTGNFRDVDDTSDKGKTKVKHYLLDKQYMASI